jgi:hypothetical protein
MDRRQYLEGIGVATHVGGLADDVVLACSALAESEMTPAVRGTLEEALALIEALGEFERPVVLTPASLDCMSTAEAVSESVGRFKPATADRRVLEELLASLAQDIQSLLKGEASDEVLTRVRDFFSLLATGMLESSELLVRPHVREFAWTTPA